MANIKKGDICPKVMLQNKKSGADRQSFCEGTNPRKYSTKLLKTAGYQKISPLKAIKAYCRDCCGENNVEALKCVAIQCPLYFYRAGTNPWDERSSLNSNSKE